MTDPTNPPAMHQPAETEEQAIQEIATAIRECNAAAKQTLAARVKLGGLLLKLRERVPPREWGKKIKALGMSQPTVSRRIRDYRIREALIEAEDAEAALSKSEAEGPNPDAICAACQAIVNSGRSALPGCPECSALREGRTEASQDAKAAAPPSGRGKKADPEPAAPAKPVQQTLDLEPVDQTKQQIELAHKTAKALNEQCCYLAAGPAGDELRRLARLGSIEFEAVPDQENRWRHPLLDWFENTMGKLKGGYAG